MMYDFVPDGKPDLRFSRASVEGLTPADRRKYLRILEEGARLCGWTPGR